MHSNVKNTRFLVSIRDLKERLVLQHYHWSVVTIEMTTHKHRLVNITVRFIIDCD